MPEGPQGWRVALGPQVGTGLHCFLPYIGRWPHSDGDPHQHARGSQTQLLKTISHQTSYANRVALKEKTAYLRDPMNLPTGRRNTTCVQALPLVELAGQSLL